MMAARARPITMADVGMVAGVSSTTVSHVINKTRFISPDTRQAVLDAIESTGYFADGNARSLRTGSTQSIGLAMSALSNPYFAEFVHAIEKESSNSGFSLVLADTHDDPDREQRAVSEILSHRVDGIILAPSAAPEPVLEKLQRLRVPAVVIDRIPAVGLPAGIDAIGVENTEPVATLVDHLVQLGHRQIAFVAPTLELTTIRERTAGFHLGAERNGVQDSTYVVTVDGDSVASAVISELLARQSPPTAIVTANNESTISTMRQLRAQNVMVPKDVALVCFDDFDWADLFDPGLTTMAQPSDEIGGRAVRMLFDRINDPAIASRVVRLAPTFKHRTSCGSPERHLHDVQPARH